jgi:hypothetical protein
MIAEMSPQTADLKVQIKKIEITEYRNCNGGAAFFLSKLLDCDAKVLPLSWGIAIADLKKGCSRPPLVYNNSRFTMRNK